MNEADQEGRSQNEAAVRKRKWRERQRQRLGGLAQLLVWVRSEDEAALRTIFEKLADPDWIGDAYRAAVAPWLTRNRPPGRIYEGLDTRSEIDSPSLDDGARIVPVGGRISAPGDTIIELTPSEAAELEQRIKIALKEVHENFIRDHGLQGLIRDTTGVIVEEQAMHRNGANKNPDRYDVDRPVDENEFWANEQSIAARVLSFKVGMLEDRGNGIFIFEYSGLHNFPSRCLVVTSLGHSDYQMSPDQPLVALVKLEHGGTPPTLCFERLTTELHRKMMPKIPAEAILWYDAGRSSFSSSRGLQITNVRLEHEKQGYRNPIWMSGEQRNQEFFRFIRRTLLAYETRDNHFENEDMALSAEDEAALVSMRP